MEYHEINKTSFMEEYNIIEFLLEKTDVMEFLKTYKEKDHAIAFGVRKHHRDTTPSWFKEFEKRLDARLTAIETRLDRHDQLFRQHGWMK